MPYSRHEWIHQLMKGRERDEEEEREEEEEEEEQREEERSGSRVRPNLACSFVPTTC